MAAIINRNHDRFHDEKAGFFGFFESIDDVDVARALLVRARQWVFDRGATFLRGPVNPSTNYECSMLIDGFDSSPMVMMSYNPRYYPGLMEQVGLTKAKDLYAYLSNANTIEMKKIDRVAEKALKAGSKKCPINMKDQSDAGVGSQRGAAQLGFIPMTRRIFSRMGKEMKMISSPNPVPDCR